MTCTPAQTHTDEEWRPVPAFEGLYEVSNLGRLRSVARAIAYRQGETRWRRGQIIRTFDDRHGYLFSSIRRDMRRHTLRVHVAVCAAFHGAKPSAKHEVRHLNGDSHDNRAVNLAWGTHQENMQDRVKHGTHHELRKTHCIRNHPLSGPNMRLRPNGKRLCRACERMREAKRVRNRKVKR